MVHVVHEPAKPLAKVIGANCRNIRLAAGVTRNELAKYARAAGLRWTDSKVGDFESGRSAPAFATVLAVTVALSNATNRSPAITVAELLADEQSGRVIVTDQIVPLASKLADALRGQPLILDAADVDASLDVEIADQIGKGQRHKTIESIEARSGLDEARLAKRLAITRETLAKASLDLWSRSFSDERDRRAGPDANAQKRGRVARVLSAEIKEMLSRGNDQ